MITAKIIRTNNKYFNISVEGHANYAEKGKDIVCCAVSTLMQFVAELLTENVETIESEGYISIFIGTANFWTETVIAMTVRFLYEIATQYPEHLEVL